MLAAFLPPYPFRGIKAPYLWLYYKFLAGLGDENAYFIAGADYLAPPASYAQENRWEFDPLALKNLCYAIPTPERLAQHRYHLLTEEVFHHLIKKNGSNPNAAFKEFLTKRIPELEVEIRAALEASEGSGVEAILSICNCPSLEAVCEEFRIPVMHVELGPLRPPEYFGTGYLDFSGVNGNTEAAVRYKKIGDLDVDLDLKELHVFVRNRASNHSLHAIESLESRSRIGVALQVENDSNLIAYSGGFDNKDLIARAAMEGDSRDRLLVRAHPNSEFELKAGRQDLDHSSSSLEFLRQCRKLFVINSSVGLEALLLNVPVCVLGDASYKFILDATTPAEQVRRLVFYVFCYLVPFDLMFNPHYLRYRLNMPDEHEILTKHLCHYADAIDQSLPTVSGAAGGSYISSMIRSKNHEKVQRAWQAEILQMQERLAAAETEKAAVLEEAQELRRIVEMERAKIVNIEESLRSALRIRDQALQEVDVSVRIAGDATIEAEAARHERDAILRSTTWRVTTPIRQAGARHPKAARLLRRCCKLLWWTATLQIGYRYSLWRKNRSPEPHE